MISPRKNSGFFVHVILPLFIGVVTAGVITAVIIATSDQQKLESTTYLYLLSKEGKVVAEYAPGEWQGLPLQIECVIRFDTKNKKDVPWKDGYILSPTKLDFLKNIDVQGIKEENK